MNRIIRLGLFYLSTAAIVLCGQESGLSDPDWVSGELDNGLRYFIRENAKPEDRIEIRLVVNAGSILEADDQQGLAHYLEHSAFNGTENFEKNEMVNFLESLGMVFGPDLNAYTSFDETVYKLKVPTDNPDTIEKAFLILSDWAGAITNTDDALENERGVVIEEWRGRRGADTRIRDQQYPVMFPGSRYAERLPIGKLDVLESFDFERLRDYYRDWYRPDLISVVVVGNLDVENIRNLVEKYFSPLENPENAPERVSYVHPFHSETQVGVFTDPELTSAQVTLMWKMSANPVRTKKAYIEDIKSALATDMLNQRLQEITQQADAPFLGAGTYQGGFTRGGDVFMLYGMVKDQEGSYLHAVSALLTEAERIKRHGFTQTELDRAVSRRIRRFEKLFAARNTTESSAYAEEMIRHALTGEFLPGIERELELHRTALSEIKPGELQNLFQTWMTDENRVVMASGPSHGENSFLPSEVELLSVFKKVESNNIDTYEDGEADRPLIEKEPTAGEIVQKSQRDDLGLLIYDLSNGIRVTLKPTKFQDDEILFSAWRAGGMNLASDAEWPHARMAAPVAEATGLGDFSSVDLSKKLSGKLVRLSAGLTMDQDQLNGATAPDDLETLLKLIHLRFTTVREDPSAFAALQERIRENVRNRLSDPKAEFSELVTQTLNLYHPRLAPLHLEDVEKIEMGKSLSYFQDRFDNAYGFNFLFTGDIDPVSFESMMEKWLGSLPSKQVEPKASFVDSKFPEYEIRRVMRKGLEPVSQVHMIWTTTDFTWNYASRHRIQSMIGVLRIRLREVLREEQGGTYHVSAWTPMEHYPEARASVRIAFSCDPNRVESLIEGVNDLITEIVQSPLEESYVQKVKEGQLRSREVDLKENSFWNYVLPFYDWHQEDPAVVLAFEDYVGRITPETIQETAAKFFDTPHQSVFILYPAQTSDAEEDVK